MALDRSQIVAAALAIVDAEGLAALSMRRLGRSLGVEAMSLYRYVGGKEELLDAVHGAILADLPPLDPGADWRRSVRQQGEGFRTLLAAHPRALPLMATRAAATAAALTQVEALVGGFEAAGFGEEEAVFAMQTVFVFVVGHAMFHLSDRPDTDEARAEFAWGIETLVAGLAARVRR